MKLFKIIEYFKNNLNLLIPTCRKFPLPILFAGLFFTFYILVEETNFNIVPFYNKVLIYGLLFCGFIWFFTLRILWDKLKKNLLSYYLISISLYIAVFLYIYTLPYYYTSLIFLIGAVLAGLCLVSKEIKSSNTAFWNVHYILWEKFSIAVFISFLFFLSLFLLILIIMYLFDIKNIYLFENIFVFSASIFAPMLYLVIVFKVIDVIDNKSQTEQLSNIFISALQNLLIPFIFIYFILLYIYFAYILIKWEIPKGQLSHIILWVSIIGTVLYLISYPLKNIGNYFVKLYHKFFFKILILPAFILCFAIYLRVSEYGITPNRYFLIVMTLWLLFITFTQAFWQKIFKFYTIVLSLTLVLLVGSIGFFSAYNVSNYSQLHRLKSIFKEHNLIENKKLKPDIENSFSFKEKKDISSIIRFLLKNKSNQLFDILPKNKDYKTTREITQDLGFKEVRTWQKDASVIENFLIDTNHKNKILDIAGYNMYIKSICIKSGKVHFFKENNSASISITLDRDFLTIKKSDTFNQSVILDIRKVVNPIFKENPRIDRVKINKEDLVFNLYNKGFNVKLLVDSIRYKILEGSLEKLQRICFEALISLDN